MSVNFVIFLVCMQLFWSKFCSNYKFVIYGSVKFIELVPRLISEFTNSYNKFTYTRDYVSPFQWPIL